MFLCEVFLELQELKVTAGISITQDVSRGGCTVEFTSFVRVCVCVYVCLYVCACVFVVVWRHGSHGSSVPRYLGTPNRPPHGCVLCVLGMYHTILTQLNLT